MRAGGERACSLLVLVDQVLQRFHIPAKRRNIVTRRDAKQLIRLHCSGLLQTQTRDTHLEEGEGSQRRRADCSQDRICRLFSPLLS